MISDEKYQNLPFKISLNMGEPYNYFYNKMIIFRHLDCCLVESMAI